VTRASATSVSRPLSSANVLVGIDDTDNLESRGTGQLARILVRVLIEGEHGSPLGATRHQLLVDPRIPYTSHNSSVCIALAAGPNPDLGAIGSVASELLEEMSAPGSDPGLAVISSPGPSARAQLSKFGSLAKREVVDQTAARELAHAVGARLTPHGGDGGGIIGALAAVGLHASGADGRFLWMPGLRDIAGAHAYDELLAAVPIDAAIDPTGAEPDARDLIDLGDWVRPVLRGGRAVLLLDPQGDASATGARRWTASSRDVVKSY
jgi:hypothetical protein